MPRKKRSTTSDTQPVKKTKTFPTSSPIKVADDNDELVKNTSSSGERRSEQSLRAADKQLSIDPKGLPNTSESSVNQDMSSNTDIPLHIPEDKNGLPSEQNTLNQDSVDISDDDSSDVSSENSSEPVSAGVKPQKDEDPHTTLLSALKQIMNNAVSSNVNSNTNNQKVENIFFCIEDTILSKDLKISVDGLGLLTYPIDKKCIERLIELSTKAKFGRGEATVLDTNVRNTQMIPASQLKVTITPNALNSLLDRIGKGLNTPEGSSLKLHFHNLLVYGPGQFFKKHKDTEKLEGMFATLVIVLPYPHKGGELIIEHDNKRHLFFGSEYPEIVKCVAFFSDCDHEIKEVTEGYRVAITCNIVLDVLNIEQNASVDKSLYKEVQDYFENGAKKLVYQLNHSYSEHSLKWSLLKAEDRICANALFAVAKKQGRTPCLALAKLHETYDVEDVYFPEKPRFIDAETELYYWVDESNENFTSPLGDEYVYNKESFFMKKTSKLFEPYEVECSGPTGNEGETEDHWYRRACVVLFASKWSFYHGFNSALTELHQMTKEERKQQLLLKKINAIGPYFKQYDFWILPHISDMLLDIVIYLNSAKKAEMILPKLKNVLLNENKVDCLIRLENQFDSQTWNKIVHIWEKDGYLMYNNTTEGISFINKYIELAGKQKKTHLVSGILGKAVDEFIERAENIRKFKFIYDRTKDEKIDKLSVLLKLTIDLECEELERKLMDHVMSASTSVYPTISKAQLCCKLQEFLKPEQMFPRFTALVTTTLNNVTTLLSQIGEHFHWSMPITSYCKCKRFCLPVLQFFSSKTCTEYVKQATKANKVHVVDNFYSFYENPYNLSIDKVKYNSYSIKIQKLPIYIEKQQKFRDDLLSFQRSLQAMDIIKGEELIDIESEEIKEELEKSVY